MNTFKETVQPLFNSVPYVSTSEGTFCDFTPALIDNLVDSTAASLRTTLDCVAPLKKKVVNQMRRAPWFNSNTRALKQTLRRLERKWRSNNLEEFYIAWKDGFVAYKKALHKARAAYYSSLIEENKNNHRFVFSTVARLTQSHSSTEPSIPLTLSSDDFINFFVNKITSIREKMDHLLPHIGTDSSFSTRALEAPGAQLDSFSPIDLPELTSLVSSSKPSTCQLDPIPTKLFKDVFPLINSSILTQINLSLLTGYVPQTFKIAVIKPLLKKATLDPDILANYRPISNLPFVSKILEKAVANQLCEYLRINGLFEDFQSGFRLNHSTETALVKVSNDLLLASDNGLVSLLVLLDLSAAFDTIDHNILLQRLEQTLGITGAALCWFKSYLSDRFQFVHVNDKASLQTKVNCGVPQGSVLGPILFTLYMLPLGNIIRKHNIHFHCYADDTQLYLSMRPDEINQVVQLQECLRDIKSWMTCNFLLLNSETSLYSALNTSEKNFLITLSL